MCYQQKPTIGAKYVFNKGGDVFVLGYSETKVRVLRDTCVFSRFARQLFKGDRCMLFAC